MNLSVSCSYEKTVYSVLENINLFFEKKVENNFNKETLPFSRTYYQGILRQVSSNYIEQEDNRRVEKHVSEKIEWKVAKTHT